MGRIAENVKGLRILKHEFSTVNGRKHYCDMNITQVRSPAKYQSEQQTEQDIRLRHKILTSTKYEIRNSHAWSSAPLASSPSPVGEPEPPKPAPPPALPKSPDATRPPPPSPSSQKELSRKSKSCSSGSPVTPSPPTRSSPPPSPPPPPNPPMRGFVCPAKSASSICDRFDDIEL